MSANRDERSDEAVAGDFTAAVLAELRRQGIDVDALGCCGGEGAPVKMVCVAANVGRSLDEMGRTRRDQVVMVRVDEETAQKLDAWVETGAVKSRSEAAALFIREGLQVRASELGQLEDALGAVEDARRKLRERVKELLGEDGEEADSS